MKSYHTPKSASAIALYSGTLEATNYLFKSPKIDHVASSQKCIGSEEKISLTFINSPRMLLYESRDSSWIDRNGKMMCVLIC